MDEGKEQSVIPGEKPGVKASGKRSPLVPVMGVIIVLLVSALIVTATPLREVLFAVKTAPEIDLEAAGDPQLEDSGRYRFEVSAKVSGNPAPEVTFNRDDSMGEAGPNRAVILLNPGETFMVIAAAKSPLGKSEASLELKAATETAGKDPDKEPPPNRNPVVTAIRFDPERIFTGWTYTVTADCSDPDGDPLTFEWSASGGHITGSTANPITWKVPDTKGDYTVTVTVRDGRGGAATESQQVTAGTFTVLPLPDPNRDPVITAIRFDPERIFTGWTYTVTADCSDPDGDPLTFEWSASGGTVTAGTANPMTWKAPDTKGEYTISVTVRDGSSGTATVSRKVTAGTFTVLPLPGPKLTTAIFEPVEIGSVDSTGFIRPDLVVGDYSDFGVQAFLSFHLVDIPSSAIIKSARLEIGSYSKYGNPFGNLGTLRVYMHDFKNIDSGDYTKPPISAEPCLSFQNEAALSHPEKQLLYANAISSIQNSLAGKARRFQLRLQFNEKETNKDGKSDIISLTNVRLVISYTP